MRKIGFACLLFLLLSLCACGKGEGFYALKSEDNQNDMFPYTCTYKNKYDKKTRTLTFTQIDEEGNTMGYGSATYDEKGRRLTYTLKDGNQNTYLSQEFTYDEKGYQTGIYTRMLGSPDCMDYRTFDNGEHVGGMLCYYDESGNIESTEVYKIENLNGGCVLSYYDTAGKLIASSGYKDTYDKNGNLLTSVTYTDGGFTEEAGRVSYAYQWIEMA